MKLDGSEVRSEFMNAPRVTTASWWPNGGMLTIISTTTFSRGDQKMPMTSTEKWTLQKRGTILSIEQTAASFRGERTATLICERKR